MVYIILLSNIKKYNSFLNSTTFNIGILNQLQPKQLNKLYSFNNKLYSFILLNRVISYKMDKPTAFNEGKETL